MIAATLGNLRGNVEGWLARRRANSTLEPAMAARLTAGIGLIVLLFASFGVWAATTPIAGAVIASGLVVVESNIKKVQHAAGGIVSAIYVKNGDRVTAGDILVSLDETQARANLGIVASQLVQLVARKARLEAERDRSTAIRFPADFAKMSDDAADIAQGEKRLFDARLTAMKGQIAQLRERVGQLRQEIKGLTAQRDAKDQEVELMNEELERLEGMRKKDLVPVTRTLAAQRDLTKLKGEWGALVAQIARAQGQISETELQIINVEQTFLTDSSKELREIEARIGELLERRIAADDLLKRIHLRAPQSGTVHDLSVHTVGGVIGPSETVMSIVPSQDVLSVEARVATSDIDQVHIGQKATLRFPAFNQRTTPEVHGTVTRIGADLSKEAQTNSVFFTARISVDDLDASTFKLVPGMPVEAFIRTDERTMLSYLLKPLTDQARRAFREQ
jgi:HlyD family secretion protein